MASTLTRNAKSQTNSVGRPPGVRELSAQATRESILRAAIKIFAKHGFSGGSVQKISKAAKSFDRMIYYYFGNKEGLFVAALEEIYRRFNEAERGLDLDPEKPVESLAMVIRFAFVYYQKHPEFIRLLNSENLHLGKHISKSRRAQEYSSPAVGTVDEIMRSGISKGLFRPDVSARDVYLLITAAGYFFQSNRYTLSSFLGENLDAPAARTKWETFVRDIVLRGISANPAAVTSARQTRNRAVNASRAHQPID